MVQPISQGKFANNSCFDLDLKPVPFSAVTQAVLRKGQMEAISTKRTKCTSGKFQCFYLLGKFSGGQEELTTSAQQSQQQNRTSRKTMLAGDSEEECWLWEEMEPAAESLILCGRNIKLVAQKLHLQPQCQSYQEELVSTAQQILMDITKVSANLGAVSFSVALKITAGCSSALPRLSQQMLLLEDACTTRMTVRAIGCCLSCLDELEAAGDADWPLGSFADLAGALQRLAGLTARGPGERLARARGLLRACVPELLAAARDPEPGSGRRHCLARARKALGQLLELLEPGAAPPPRQWSGALPRRLRQLRQLQGAPAPELLRRDRLDALLEAVVWLCLRLAAGAAPRERLRLLARCRRLLERRSAGARRLGQACGTRGPGALQPGEESAALWVAAEALSQGARTELLRQILDTFTDMQSPLQRLVQAAMGNSSMSCPGPWPLPKSLQFSLAAFHEKAKQMFRVAHLVLVCCPRQETKREMEITMAYLWGLVVRVQQLFSQNPQSSELDWTPAALQAVLQAWTRASECLLACFDDVLYIPEFLTVSVQEMTKHLYFFTWALRSEDCREFSMHVAYLQGRATHIVQVMKRYVGQNRDPILRNGLRVLIQHLEQSSLVLGAAAERFSGKPAFHDAEAVLAMAKHLVSSAQSIREGLDGTNHPDILSPLRSQVRRFDIAKERPHFILASFQDSLSPTSKLQGRPALGDSDSRTCYPRRDYLSCPMIPDTHPLRAGSFLPDVSKPACSQPGPPDRDLSTNPQKLNLAVNIVQEVLAGKGPLESETMTRLQEILTLAPSINDLAREMGHCSNARADRLLELDLPSSERNKETRHALVAIAGNWYLLCQQLFCQNQEADLAQSVAVFVELQQNLTSLVQLATKCVPMDLGKKGPYSTEEALLQMQGRLGEAETHAKELLNIVLISDGLQTPESWKESIEDECLLWSVAVQDLLHCIEKFSKRQCLFLLPLRQAIQDQQGLQAGLVRVADVSRRLQEATRLSSQLCGNEQVKGEVLFLCREVHVLTDALLDVAQILTSSPKPSPSVSTWFELLFFELTLRSVALIGHLNNINADYEHAFHDAFCPWLSVCNNSWTSPENNLQRIVSGIQEVQKIVARNQESGSCSKDLSVALEDILILTQEMAQKISVLQQHPEERGILILDWPQWEWAAKAHHAVAQLKAWKGGPIKAWRLLTQCLKSCDKQAKALEQSLSQLQPHCGEHEPAATAENSMHLQGVHAPEGSPGNIAGSADSLLTSTPAADLGRMSQDLPDTPQCLTWNQSLPECGTMDSENRITQLIQAITKEVLLMAGNLKRRGHMLTKDQLIASARKIAICGQNFARLASIIAKNCVDPRCSQELWCAVEQTQTMSRQLCIISSVKASLARSKCSEELLVENAQQLLQVVSKTMRAAEAASLRGLRQPSTDPEELEVTAFSVQWRRKLLRHRLQEASNLDCDELGLRKTSTKRPPTLAALV
ncbi:LOW QUALITY PROTEIN: uncharacterized protein LOC132537586 [Erinaceus europaeus]|uniref:LOW QUALITY PROTEIN: uncharacterized protein LOC132537586 n=1 Tax=Erinaceus europaeus TaxID=9365 RepID=A0ABM3X6G7_ERIEU|nr:LOW QUALITY PROTEIN: uncharacterized protein LOC132537586 [Erinaceus europaeus]